MFKELIARIILVTFFFASIGPFPDASAQSIIDLPAPGMMVNKSDPFQPLQLKGILVSVKDPLRFEFLVDKGDSGLYGQPLKDDITRLAKYFLTCLAVPENDLWVNLSPYEKERIVPGNFGTTLMGRDLLEQDYLLKQIMASLSYPENDLGKRFWQKVYRRSYELYGTTNIPINTFNKVWIIPQSAQVYVQGNAAFVVNSRLNVMLDADYKAFARHGLSEDGGAYSQVLREVILPQLGQEINEGKNFAVVRQVYNAMILATWYKRHLKDSLLGRMYVGRNEVKGVDIADKNAKEEIFRRYLEAYKKCVYNYIKEDYDPATGQTVPRKYASGGMYFAGFGAPNSVYEEISNPKGMKIGTDLAMATVDVSATNSSGEMVRFPYWKAEITDTHPFHQVPFEVHEDEAMISGKTAALARKIILPLLVLIAVSVSAPSLAAQITPNLDARTLQVEVLKNDTFGDILLQAGYHGHLWGPKGLVAKVAKVVKPGIHNVDRIFVGNKFNIPAPEVSIWPAPPAVTIIQQVPPAAATIQQAPPAAATIQQASPTVTTTPQAPPTVTTIQPASPGLGNVSAGPPPPPPEEMGPDILQNLKQMWPWYVGIGILGLMMNYGVFSLLRKKKLKEPKEQPVDDLSKTIPFDPAGPPKAWVFRTDEGPALPDADELAWAQKQQKVVTAPVSLQSAATLTPAAAPSGLVDMNLLSAALGTGAAASYSNWDLTDMGIAFLVTVLGARLFYAVGLWLHEIGHILVALVQSPKNYKKILTLRNILGNYSVSDWFWMGLAFSKPSRRAGVDLPLTGIPRRINQTAGFVISAALSGFAFWFAVKTGLWPPLFGPLTAVTVFLLYNSFMTDIWDPSDQGNIECGDSGFIWWKNNQVSKPRYSVEDFFPRSFQAAQRNMRNVAALRGDQGEGLFTWGQTSDGDVVPFVFKALKSKRGDPVTVVAQSGFNRMIRQALGQNISPVSGSVREVLAHDRFVTQGAPSQEGLHPHLGVIEERKLCFYINGEYQKRERTIVTTVIENGDNDYHQKHGTIMPTSKIREFYPVKFHMKKTVYIAPNAANPQGYYDYLPTGDAPPLALQEQWYDNQGDWWASSRFALDEVFYQSVEESMEYNLSKDEEDAMGDLFMSVYEHGHEEILIRPKYRNKNKTLADSWVTKEMAEKHPELAFQYEALENFRTDLKMDLYAEMIKAAKDQGPSTVGRILLRLHQLHPDENIRQKIDSFIDMTVKRFFTADIFEAAKEIDELTRGTGTYGVRVLNSKYPARGVFWTRGQNIALGENMQAGFVAYNSEHTALMSNFADAPPVKEVLFLNSEGQGQLTETNFDQETKELVIRAYSPEKKRFLSEGELKALRMELDPSNEYYTPLIERDPENVADEDIADIPRAIREAEERWGDPRSFVRQSADELFNKMASRYVEGYIKNNSRFYKVMHGNLLYAIDQMYPLPGDARDLRASLLRAVQHDPRIMTYLKSRLDMLVAMAADHLSQRIISGKSSEDDLFPQLQIIDTELSSQMEKAIRVLAENLGNGILDKESIGAGETDLYVAGLEDSLWIGAEGLKAMLHTIFPEMVIETESANKALNLKPNDHYNVGRRTIALVVSKSGATSPTKNLVPILKKITPGNIFAMTGRVDTLIGLSLGQRYYKGAPFSRRIFPTGNYYPSEVNSTSEVELLLNQIEMVLYMVKRMKNIFPHQRPWGMDISDENIEKLEQWRDKILNKAEHMTNAGYKENKEILSNAQIFGKMITETPLVNLFHRAFVFCIFYFGAPLATTAVFLENMTGLPVHSSGLGHFISAGLDATLALTLPWWVTTGVYRIFSGRMQLWARLGPPKVTIGDIPVLHQTIENSASKRGAMAIASMDVDYHGGNPQDHFGVRFLHRLRRGSIEIFGLPEDAHSRSNILMTDSQSNVRTDMSVGNKIWDWLGKRFLAGPEIFTIGHGNVDPNLTQHHMNIGPLETVTVDKDGMRETRTDITESLNQFYGQSFEVLDRLIAYNVFFNEAYRWATKWGRWRVWRPWESISKTGVHSTPTPVSGPRKKLSDYHDTDKPYAIDDVPDGNSLGSTPLDHAQVASTRKGGIDMNSRLMQLKITGETPDRMRAADTGSWPVIKGVVPQVSGIVTVTPEMLKAMLGTAYLN